MLSFPFGVLLIPYAILLAVVAFFYLTNIYHLIQTGTLTVASILLTVIFLIFSVFVVALTWSQISTVDWRAPITIQLGGSSNPNL